MNLSDLGLVEPQTPSTELSSKFAGGGDDDQTQNSHTAEQNTAEQNTAEQNTAEQNTAEQNTAEQNAAEQGSGRHTGSDSVGLVVLRKVMLKSSATRKAKPIFKKKEQSIQSVPPRDAAAPGAGSKQVEPDKPNRGPAESFTDMDLARPILEAVSAAGYSKPSQIQAAIIPALLQGRDVIAQSQTGSGKTAAFALPLLSNLKLGSRKSSRADGPSVLVLAPTRELAMQVAASFEKYAGSLDDFAVTAIYGGQDYLPQKRALRSGASVVVGTPGRVIDMIRQGLLKIDNLQCLVLDEADEMLNMGFLEDVEFVLQQCPRQRQVALFSATMPGPIRQIADRYLTDPVTVTIKSKAMTAESIRQRAIFTSPREKMDLLSRVLESESIDGVIIFVKTKETTTVVADKLVRSGHAASALNGDMPQNARQRVIENLKSGRLDIIVATDVAARGLDVPRISHVINYDFPHDRESYVHRIGRTGRAGRDGNAILFLSPSARHRLRSIQQMTRQEIEIADWPSIEQINQQRIANFKQRITETLAKADVSFFETLITQQMEETGQSVQQIAAALAHIGNGRGPFLLTERKKPARNERPDRGGKASKDHRGKQRGFDRSAGADFGQGTRRYRVEVGRVDGVRPSNLVGAIANEAGIDSAHIGQISIGHRFTTVDLPDQLGPDVLSTLEKTRVMGKSLRISVDTGPPSKNRQRSERGKFGGKRKSGKHKKSGKRT